MIQLTLPAVSDAKKPFVTRLSRSRSSLPHDSWCIQSTENETVFSGESGLFQISGPSLKTLEGDIVIITPAVGKAERIIRAGSTQNSLLVTERCDQLCVMCSQPPKKTHNDRFDLFIQACLLTEKGITIGITGGEPTLFKHELFHLLEAVLELRPDLNFHVLTNGQHFEPHDIPQLRQPKFRNVVWGIPLYSDEAIEHDQIVAKAGAHERLHQSFDTLLSAGARIELRTVVLQSNLNSFPALARHVSSLLHFIEQWSVMHLENIGFAKNRWDSLYVDFRNSFGSISEALDIVTLFGVQSKLFNVPLCHLPESYRHFAVNSISDWKQRFGERCSMCNSKAACSGFFEWHPSKILDEVVPI
tara:strand:- start:239 stop:1315 length:1077 start_codon:yes stop_codon:yes gene_type:complete